MLDSEFLSQMQTITLACTHESLQKAVFSATLPANAEKVAMAMLNDPIRVVVGLKCVFPSSFLPFIHSQRPGWVIQGYTPPAHRPIAYIRRGRPVQASQSPHLPCTTLQPASPNLHVHSISCIFPRGRTRLKRYLKCGLPPRWDESERERGCREPDA